MWPLLGSVGIGYKMKALIDTEERKECSTCSIIKPLSAFHNHKKTKDGVTAKCRNCRSIVLRKWYSDNRLRRQQVANEKNRAKKKKAIDLLGGRCYDCQGIFDNIVYDFHHTTDDKEGNLSDLLHSTPEKAFEELNKCVLLCANCHRIRHKGP
jgi:hypothetical protein